MRDTLSNKAFSPAAASPRSERKKNTPVEQLRIQHCMEAVLALRDQPSLSRLDLCRVMQRSTTTMTKVVADLMACGWVRESSTRQAAGAGRPRTLLRLAPEAFPVLAVSVEPDAVHSAVLGLDLQVAEVRTLRLSVSRQPPQDSLQALAAIVARHARALRDAGLPALRGVAIVLPGMTDTALRVVRRAPFLGWKDYAVAEALQEQIALPVWVHNNTRAMAFAEFRHLALHEDQPMLFVQARVGLGAALVNSARPSQHAHYGVAELGQIPLGINRFSTQVATAGELVSVTNEAYLRAVLDSTGDADALLGELEGRREAGEALAVTLYAQTVENLAGGLAIAVNLLNPHTIVLGGIYAHASERFIDDLARGIRQRARDELTDGLRLQCTRLGRQGALQGAAIVAYAHLLRDPNNYRAD